MSTTMILDRCNRYASLIAIYLVFASAACGQQDAPPAPDYTVLPGDSLEISVWGEENLHRKVLVRPDGGFSFPLCGDISARDKTVVELQAEITKQLGRYITAPVVTVSVAEILGNKVYVIGQVNRPGVFVMNPNVDVLQALSMAGGTTPFASLKDIKILRRTGAIQQALSFNYDEVIKGTNLKQNTILQSGDVVIVP